jgi:hypothetical protein
MMFPNQGVQQWSPQQTNAQYPPRQNQQANAQVSPEFPNDMHAPRQASTVSPGLLYCHTPRRPRNSILPSCLQTLTSACFVTTSKLAPLPTNWYTSQQHTPFNNSSRFFINTTIIHRGETADRIASS